MNATFPNIVFIMTDDQGEWALGCSGNGEIETPNIDRLAEQGIRFENFFCASPVCSPARASLLTGRIPSQHGVQDWIRRGNGNRKGEPAIEYLAGQRAYTEILAERGYVCGISGKWHLGDSFKPQKGFSHWTVTPQGGGRFYNGQIIRDGELITTPEYLTDVITEDALGFIDSQADSGSPFYLSVHYTAPHSPWIDQHPKELVDRYESCPFESAPQENRHPWFSTQELVFSEDCADLNRREFPIREHLKGYYASVTAVDSGVGRIVDALQARGELENTLVVFTSDNGFNCGHHGIWGKGNATFPANMYDTSVKVPFIACHPGRIPPGQVCDALVSGYDFMPTLLEYLGIESCAEGLAGRSFCPQLLGLEDDADRSVYIYDEYGPTRMVRAREWKYVHRYPYGPHELYDLVADPGERVNLAGRPERAGLVEEMRRQLEGWFLLHVDPDRDASRQPVCGRGQLAEVGERGRGALAFHPREARKNYNT